MSNSENKPIQDVLREAAPCMIGCTGWGCWWNLARALGLKDDDPGTCLETIADRVDAQCVVEIMTPSKYESFPLPKDADGVTCHFGDDVLVQDSPDKTLRGKVHAINEFGDVLVMFNGCEVWADTATVIRHVKPRSIDEVMSEVECAGSISDIAALVHEAYEIGKKGL